MEAGRAANGRSRWRRKPAARAPKPSRARARATAPSERLPRRAGAPQSRIGTCTWRFDAFAPLASLFSAPSASLARRRFTTHARESRAPPTSRCDARNCECDPTRFFRFIYFIFVLPLLSESPAVSSVPRSGERRPGRARNSCFR